MSEENSDINLKPMSQEKDTNNIVIVQRDLNTRSMFDRTDPLGQPDQIADRKEAYRNATFSQLRRAKESAERFVNQAAQTKNPKLSDAEQNVQLIWDEIKTRRREAVQQGLLAPIDQFMYERKQELDQIETGIVHGTHTEQQLESFLKRLNIAEIRHVNLPPIPQDQMDRLGGIQEFRWSTRLTQLRDIGTRLLNRLQHAQNQQPTPVASPVSQPTGLEQSLQRLVDIGAAQLSLSEEQLQLSQKGYDHFIQLEGDRSPALTPEAFGSSGALTWLRGRSEGEQHAIRTRVGLNYLCVAKTQNKEDLDAWATIKTPITREGMQGMWEEQPGFRQVMATFMRDLFELKDGHLEISENGYNILKPQGGLNRYKDRVASSLRDYINDLPNKDRILQNERVSINQIADAAVNAVDNFLFAMCMYDSGDVKRKIEDSNLYTEAPRAMMMPGVKGKAKWIKGELTEAPQGTEEGWGGKLGEWIRIRSERDKDFRKKVGNGELQYLPDRIVYGAFDHLLFDKSYVGGVDVNLSAALRYDDNRFKKIFINGRESGLYDYVEGSDAVDFTKLVAADLYDSWCNTRDSAKNIYTHLTAKDAKKVFSVEAGNIDTLINSYVRCANNPMLQAFYRDPQTVTAIYARAALPEGFNEYSSEILPPDVTHAGIEEYDRRVRRILEDDRIPRILGGDTKNALAWKSSIYYLLNAKEPGFNKYNTDHIVTGRRWKAVAAAVFEKTRVEVGNKL